MSYFLTGEFIPYDRESGTIGRVIPFRNFGPVNRLCGGTGGGWGAWNVAMRYDYLNLTDGGITGGSEGIGTFALNWFNYTLSTQGNQYAPVYMGALLVVVMLFFPRGIIVTIAEFLRRRRWKAT